MSSIQYLNIRGRVMDKAKNNLHIHRFSPFIPLNSGNYAILTAIENIGKAAKYRRIIPTRTEPPPWSQFQKIASRAGRQNIRSHCQLGLISPFRFVLPRQRRLVMIFPFDGDVRIHADLFAGADLEAISDPERRNEIEATGMAAGPMGPSRMVLSKPVIVAVSGYAAETLAADIAGFPQKCLRADRHSAAHQWDMKLAAALAAESARGYPVVFEEAIEGAGRLAGGAGRH